jgi:sRNA-binding carbon storage regulator CsrA
MAAHRPPGTLVLASKVGRDIYVDVEGVGRLSVRVVETRAGGFVRIGFRGPKQFRISRPSAHTGDKQTDEDQNLEGGE